MKVMILAYEPPEEFARRETQQTDQGAFQAYMQPWITYSQGLADKGLGYGSAALETPDTATVLSVRDGKRIVEDGPFVSSKEQLGGFFVVDAPDMLTAQSWAAECPAARTGFTEVYVVPNYGQED